MYLVKKITSYNKLNDSKGYNMGQMYVKQPNGKLGIFSEVVDDFIEVNFTEEEALIRCKETMSPLVAARKVNAAIENLDPFTKIKGKELGRWNYCLDIITSQHGKKHAAEILELCEKI